MNFLYTSFLPALAAVTLPILIHLFSRRRLPTIPFSTVRFLQKLQRRKARRVQLKQILLLIIRALAIAAVVFAFARPASQVGAGAGSAAAVEMVAVLDDGLSASAASGNGRLLYGINNRLQSLFSLLGPNDRLTLISAADPAWRFQVTSGRTDIFRERLESLEPKMWRPDIPSAVRLTDSLFVESPRFNRELFIIGGLYDSSRDSLPRSIGEGAARRIILPVGPERIDNFAIEGLKWVTTLHRKGNPVDLAVKFANYSSRDASDLVAAVYIAEQRVAQIAVNLPADGMVERTFTFTPNRAGLIDGWVVLEQSDVVEVDNRRYFILNVPDSLRLMVVAPDSGARRTIAAVLGEQTVGYLKLDWPDPLRWEAERFGAYDGIILAGVGSTTPGAADRLRSFVEQGGGIIIFQGYNTDLNNLSRGLWRSLGFGGAAGMNHYGGLGWVKPDLDHPLFAGVFEPGGEPRSPLFNTVTELAVGDDDRVLIRLANGLPLLVEGQIGRGRALMFSAVISDLEPQFIFSGVFAPLLLRSVAYVSSRTGDGENEWIIGEPGRIFITAASGETGRLIMPNGDEVALPPRLVPGGGEYILNRVPHPGIYDFYIGEFVMGRFAANPPAGLGNLERAGRSDLESRFGGEIVDSDGEQLTAELARMRFGREWWRPIALAALMLLLAESVLGKGRGGE